MKITKNEKIQTTTGDPFDFRNAIEDKIAQLESNNIEFSTDIKASTDLSDELKDACDKGDVHGDLIDVFIAQGDPDNVYTFEFNHAITDSAKSEDEIIKALTDAGYEAKATDESQSNFIVIEVNDKKEVESSTDITASYEIPWKKFIDDFSSYIHKYLPEEGQGNNFASQVVTCVNKLIYKWFNDGDVYDNTYFLDGWENDVSSYANWLFNHVDGAADILLRIKDARDDGDYTRILYNLAEAALIDNDLDKDAETPTYGDIYNADGPFKFQEYDEDEDDEDYYEDEEDDYSEDEDVESATNIDNSTDKILDEILGQLYDEYSTDYENGNYSYEDLEQAFVDHAELPDYYDDGETVAEIPSEDEIRNYFEDHFEDYFA